jgi:solute:Na+ symporter, SSS family
MDSTNFIDALVVAVYLVLAFGFGLLAKKLLHSDTSNEEGYFLAGRKMKGWINGISYAVTAMNSDVAPVYCGMAVGVGLSISWFYLSRFGFSLLVVGMLFAVRWRQLGIATGPEFYALRFGGRGGGFIRVYSSLFTVFIGMVPWIGTGMLGLHKIFGPIFGIESKLVTLAIVLPVLVIYVWLTGFSGVLVTDVVQVAVILVAYILVIVMVLINFGGPTGLREAVIDVLPKESPEILSAFPVPGHEVLGPMVVLAWFAVITIGQGGNVGMEGQRIFSCKDHKEAAKVLVWGQVSLFVMLLILTLPGLAVLAKHPELYHASPAVRETAYGLLLKDYLPVGILGLTLAALLSSVMSTIDSHMNFGAQTLLNDVYKPIFGTPPEQKALWIGRIMMIVVLLSAIAVVYYSTSLIQIVVLLAGLFGSTAAFGWGQWWWWRVNIWSWISGYLSGPFVYFGLGFLLKHSTWWQQQLDRSETMVQSMAMLQAVIAMVVTTVIWILVTLLTKPEDMEVLKKFYRRAHPMGHWGPVREAIRKEDGLEVLPGEKKYLIAGGFAAVLFGFAWVALAVLSLSELFIGKYATASGYAIASIIFALCFKRVFGWHIARLDVSDRNRVEEPTESAPVS